MRFPEAVRLDSESAVVSNAVPLRVAARTYRGGRPRHAFREASGRTASADDEMPKTKRLRRKEWPGNEPGRVGRVRDFDDAGTRFRGLPHQRRNQMLMMSFGGVQDV